jgi:crossover junction endodeoxyribonuclease RusA
MIRVTLPLPPRELHPNARVHWRKKSRATREYRRRAWAEAMRATPVREPRYARATCRVWFYLPDNRRRDSDNLLAWMKAGIDGLADAGIVENDRAFSFPAVEVALDRNNPRVILEVTPL